MTSYGPKFISFRKGYLKLDFGNFKPSYLDSLSDSLSNQGSTILIALLKVEIFTFTVLMTSQDPWGRASNNLLLDLT